MTQSIKKEKKEKQLKCSSVNSAILKGLGFFKIQKRKGKKKLGFQFSFRYVRRSAI